MPTGTGREFSVVLAKVLACIPEGADKDYIAGVGARVQTSLGYAPPEDQGIHWLRFASALEECFSTQNTPWQREIGRIMRDEEE